MIIYTNNICNLDILRESLHIQYYSTIFKYAVVYIDEPNAVMLKERLLQNQQIKKVEIIPKLIDFENLSTEQE